MSAVLDHDTDQQRGRAIAQLRVPPHSIEAESSVLGCLLLDNEALHRLPDLTAEQFYRREHRLVMGAIRAQAGAGKAFDVVTTWEWLKARGEDEGGQMLPYLNSLAQYVPSAGNVRRYAEIVRDHALLRAVAAAADETATAAFNPQGKSAAELIDAAQMRLAKLATVKRRHEPQHISASLPGYLRLLQELSEGKNPAMSTGIGGFDRILNGGLRRGGMLVLGARPKHGKTALALSIARYVARRSSVLYISQEMPIPELMHRHTAAVGSIDLGRILAADAKDTELWSRVNEAAERLGALNLTHDDQSAQSLMDVRRKAIQTKRQRGLDLLVVDFLQLMQGGGEDNRNRELDVIANGIKALALDLDCAVILLSQLTREADKSYNRPTMTHLRDSGAIEAAADVVALLYTDHAHPMSKRLPEFAGFSELEVVAQRNGPQGLAPLNFVGKFQQLGDWMGEIPKHPARKTERGMD